MYNVYLKVERVEALSTETKLVLTGRLSLTASTGAWKGQANWCFHRTFTTILSRYWSWLVWRFGLLGLMHSGAEGLSSCWTCPWLLLLLPDICAASRPSPILTGLGVGSGPGAGAGAEAGAGVVVFAGHQFSLGPDTDSTDRVPLIPLHSSPDSLERKYRILLLSCAHAKLYFMFLPNSTRIVNHYIAETWHLNIKLIQKNSYIPALRIMWKIWSVTLFAIKWLNQIHLKNQTSNRTRR